MKAKNVIAMILAGVSSVSLLAGCGASKTAESSTASSAAQTEAQSSAADTTAAESSGTGRGVTRKKVLKTQQIKQTLKLERHWLFITLPAEIQSVSQRQRPKQQEQICFKLCRWNHTPVTI